MPEHGVDTVAYRPTRARHIGALRESPLTKPPWPRRRRARVMCPFRGRCTPVRLRRGQVGRAARFPTIRPFHIRPGSSGMARARRRFSRYACSTAQYAQSGSVKYVSESVLPSGLGHLSEKFGSFLSNVAGVHVPRGFQRAESAAPATSVALIRGVSSLRAPSCGRDRRANRPVCAHSRSPSTASIQNRAEAAAPDRVVRLVQMQAKGTGFTRRPMTSERAGRKKRSRTASVVPLFIPHRVRPRRSSARRNEEHDGVRLSVIIIRHNRVRRAARSTPHDESAKARERRAARRSSFWPRKLDTAIGRS